MQIIDDIANEGKACHPEDYALNPNRDCPEPAEQSQDHNRKYEKESVNRNGATGVSSRFFQLRDVSILAHMKNET
jgi:hypothetical protein